MSFPYVEINTLNLLSGETKEIERHALFIGVGTKNLKQLISLTPDSDFDEVFGEVDSELKKQVKTAMLNAGSRWYAHVYQMPDDDYDFEHAVMEANHTSSFEYCVNTNTLGVDKTNINKLQELYKTLVAKLGRRTFFIQSIAGIDNNEENGESWAEYVARLTELQKTLVCDHVKLVPNLFGTDTGALAGRLANTTASIADSPCRVKTGALVGINAEKPTDKDGVTLDISVLKSLELARFSTVMWYPDYDGYYWSDGRTLDVEGGDYQTIENVRVVDKAARRIRLQAIAKIGDRSLNSTQASIETHQTYFSRTLRKMSKSIQIAGVDFPGECYPPEDGDIKIAWKNKTEVAIYLRVRTMECPKGITVNIFLDLTTLGGK
ncbi:DUF2586 domain-containing protein [Pasteurella skyensis]|uniref:DUF2586 domain-containing protein n=1 Tax=Phocoenobacter skyensis TaxID=97481 RepID=A0AAJ6NBD9_9PAST|nr:DUF2586 domain-containing protein [Pasteurella skyensis]MDP8173678.1 DUF2586 domain-containing protein [Pasteurella skyensis]MDP8178046.1 DUF2586 domain-containing protein [Pasteurella skyensis]